MSNTEAFAAIVEEHDAAFHTKKVSPFLGDGQGGLVRQGADGFNMGLYDDITLNYTSGTLTSVDFKSGGMIVNTLTLTYAGSQLTNVDLT